MAQTQRFGQRDDRCYNGPMPTKQKRRAAPVPDPAAGSAAGAPPPPAPTSDLARPDSPRAERAARESAEMTELEAADLAALLGSGGPVAALLEGYEPRPSQIAMALAVREALLTRRHALIEAPTGTGKSMAYLLPAILSGRTVVVATANKSLQNQLFAKDIPFLRRALNREIDAVVVKGRSNYLCNYKWEKELEEQRLFRLIDREHDAIPLINTWLESTQTGDVDELPVLLDGDLRPRIVSFPDDCLQSACPHWEDNCWINYMRDRAAEAQIIVTNHHLLLNALELGQAGERILPPASIYIVDEAHSLEQTATSVYETTVTDYTVEQLLARTILREHADNDRLDEIRMQNTLAFQEITIQSKEQSFVLPGEYESLRTLGRALNDLADSLKRANPYGEPAADETRTPQGRETAESRQGLELAIEQLNSTATKLLSVATAKRDDDYVRYAVRIFDRRKISLELHAAPINPGGLLAKYLFDQEPSTAGLQRMVICTSATLSTDGGFAHLRARCGIDGDCVERVLPPVFDYPRQALLYQPALPAFDWRSADAYYTAAAREIERLLEVSRGRALCLFTSWSGLQQVARRLRGDKDAESPVPATIWPLRAQGDAPRDALLDWFRATPHSVLLATRSFWEGVDIPGDDLSLVVLDKMPFPTPNDPLHSARMRELDAAQEGASFGQYMLPLMTLSLKQGFGRLIRRGSDRGVVAILDERLSSKGYGRQAQRNLPPARGSRDFKDVHRFFQHALQSEAEFALNVRAHADRDDSGAPVAAWRWQLIRLSDGRADVQEGTLPVGDAPDSACARAAMHAVTVALRELRARVERAGRSPALYAVEVRCDPETAAALEGLSGHAARAEIAHWRVVRTLVVTT